jgi:hypothetical protein
MQPASPRHFQIALHRLILTFEAKIYLTNI